MYRKIITFGLVIGLLVPYININAASKEELQSNIASYNLEIAKLEKEIEEFSNKLDKTQAEKQTLSKAINQLDLTRKKLASEIALTGNKITTTEYNIEQLEIDISEAENSISNKTVALEEAVRTVHEKENQSLVEVFLSSDSISESLTKIDAVERVQVDLNRNLADLKVEKDRLVKDLENLDASKKRLTNLHASLSDQKYVADENKKEKEALLSRTKNQESEYQKLLRERQEAKEKFEAELLEFESQLASLDPSQIPGASPGLLAWPTEKVKINQYFGDTSFSRNNPQIYRGRGHRGVDFWAPTGTPLLAIGNGVVKGVGDTDTGCPGGSWGKWVYIEHYNGLASVYGHMSRISVEPGQTLNTGDVVGYSGSTGNVTGPHLHLGVYVAEGLRIGRIIKADGTPSSCPEMPLSPLNGYLNPLAYMPAINPETNRPL